MNDISFYCSFVSHFLFVSFVSLLRCSPILSLSDSPNADVWCTCCVLLLQCFCFPNSNTPNQNKITVCNWWFGGVLNQRFHLENLACHYSQKLLSIHTNNTKKRTHNVWYVSDRPRFIPSFPCQHTLRRNRRIIITVSVYVISAPLPHNITELVFIENYDYE